MSFIETLIIETIDDERRTRFGALLRYRRKSVGMTQQQIAEICGCTDKHISGLELGNRGASLEIYLKICELFGLSFSQNFPLHSLKEDAMRNLITVRQLAEDPKNPFKESTIRQWIFFCSSNGFHEVVFRVGRRIYLDVDRLSDWLERQNLQSRN